MGMNAQNAQHAQASPVTLGVLTDTELLLVSVTGGKKALSTLPFPPQPDRLDAVLGYAWRTGLTSVWVLPGTRLSGDISLSWLQEACPGWQLHAYFHPDDPARLIGARVWPKEDANPHGLHGLHLTLTFPEHAGWPWVLPDATTLLATVTYLEQALGRPLACSPHQLTADLLTDLTLDMPASWFRPPTAAWHSLLGSDGNQVPIRDCAREMRWMRPLSLLEMHGKYLHRYDHLSLYLEAAMGAQLGAGEPIHAATGRAYDGKRPGLWRVSSEVAGSVFDGKRLPSCLTGAWMSTPQVSCCTTIAYRVQVHEGSFWPESHPALEHWARTFWQVTHHFSVQATTYRHVQARANAIGTIRHVARLGVDLLAQHQVGGAWSRPDWGVHLIGGACATLFAHLAALVRKGYMPVLLDMDSLWLVSNDPDPRSAFPGLLTADTMGRYTAGYPVPLALSADVKACLRTARDAREVAVLVKELNALADDPLSGASSPVDS